MREQFEEKFPIPAHWIEWNDQLGRYDCHVGLADSKCSEYNKMFDVWKSRQADMNELTHFNNNQYKSITDRDLEIKKLSELICKLLEDKHTYMRPSIARECIVAVGWNP
ncbi:hypothetical protein RFH42_11090 [Acinetobacter rudis]|uniref:hypothetical protein n=1 Tax=Acinetobacter rudis TaxID=632955 RepID=UPI00280E4657|nr:hypothetical protein [Acinetobacter rudis]MDQ8953505.1 hypothetical protein [Acinetobacter rudis]